MLLTASSLPAPESSAWLATHGIDQSRVRVQLKEWARAVFRRRAATGARDVPGPRHPPRPPDLRPPRSPAGGAGRPRRRGYPRDRPGSPAPARIGGEHGREARDPPDRGRTGQAGPSPANDGVVVGIAGDEGDAAAVDLAFRVAAARDLPVTAFHAVWDVVGLDETRDVPGDEPEYEAERSLISERDQVRRSPLSPGPGSSPDRPRLRRRATDPCVAKRRAGGDRASPEALPERAHLRLGGASDRRARGLLGRSRAVPGSRSVQRLGRPGPPTLTSGGHPEHRRGRPIHTRRSPP